MLNYFSLRQWCKFYQIISIKSVENLLFKEKILFSAGSTFFGVLTHRVGS